MAWVRIDDAVTEHRKHLKAGPAACWLWVCGIAYCQRQLSDGFIPDEALPFLGVSKGVKSLAVILVDVKLFERIEGGYLVHDYHAYNQTREEVIARLEDQHASKVRAGRAGGQRSGEARRNTAVEAEGQQAASSVLKQNEAPSHPIPSHKEQEVPGVQQQGSVVQQVIADYKAKHPRNRGRFY